uniref:Glycoside hydrolase family 5 domain-containing protein n=1 Tax=Globisporangium ultimum (strain ATCC 200006 / CBS 805.95 / DAOM BR144) TaxID=431595 RepID=K3X5K9_GLOUD
MTNTIDKVTPKWVIFVEGMSQASRDDPNTPCFSGGNLMIRLVYSLHMHNPDVSDMSYFHNASFPFNMPAIWDEHFGFVWEDKRYNGEMIIGEWGCAYHNEGTARITG